MTDSELLREYVQTHCDQAFAELVRRHIDWLSSAALRQTRNRQLADDVTQAACIALALKARSLCSDKPLAPWLFQVIRHAAANTMRSETRRNRHEQRAAAMTPESSPIITETQWGHLAPVLDELVAKLTNQDRLAVLLRFYQGKSFEDVGKAMGVSEEAARKRADRAVDKLRGMFAKRGFTAGAATLATALAANITLPANAALAATTITTALAATQATAVAGHALAIAKGALQTMAWAKAKLIVATGVTLLLLGGGATVMTQHFMAQRSPQPVASQPSTQRGLAVAPAVNAADNALAAAESNITNQILVDAWHDYLEAVRTQKSPASTPGWYSTWDKRFRDGLEMPGGDRTLRLRVMMELAVIQPEVGNSDAANAIWENIVTLADRWRMPGQRLLALEDLWGRSQKRPLDTQLALAAQLQKAYEEARTLPVGAVPLTGGRTIDGLISDLHLEIAGRYRGAANWIGEGKNAESPQYREHQALLEKAETWYMKSLDTKADGINPRVNKLFTLGEVELKLGKRAEAGQRFQEILGDKSQKTFARMWVAHLELQARYGIDTKDYRDGVVQILRDYPADDYVLHLKQALAFSYIHADQPAAAAAVLEQIAASDSHPGANAYNSFLLAKCYRDMGDAQRANDLFADIIKRWPKTSAAKLARYSLSAP